MNNNDIIQKILSYFRTVCLFESKNNNKIYKPKNFKIKKYSSFKLLRNKFLINFIKKSKKDIRFKKNQSIYVLFYKKKIVCTGWMFEGNSWYISEINKTISIKNKILLYDFFTFQEFRNKGFYCKILRLIKNYKTKNSFLIYCLKNNISSKKGILNSNFKLITEMK